MKNICAVIPAYNEERAIESILKQLKDREIDTIVVDDGSTDGTEKVACAYSTQVIRHESNMGKGRALRDGFSAALQKGYDFIVTVDADGQHDINEIHAFIDGIHSAGAGMVIGNRLHSPTGMPGYRLFINRLFSGITSLVCRQRIADVACGYRIIKKEVLETIKLSTERFDIDFELIIKAVKAGFPVAFLNIKCIYADEQSHIRPLEYWNSFFRLIIKEIGTPRLRSG